MTNKTKAIIGIVGGVVVLGSIGAAAGGSGDKTSNNSSSQNADSGYVSTIESTVSNNESSIVISTSAETSSNDSNTDTSEPENSQSNNSITESSSSGEPAIELPTSTSTESTLQNSEPPIETPSSNGITLVSFNNNLRRNEDATIKIQGNPNTQYTIYVYYSSGASTADGLEPKMSDSDGYVSWTWHVGGKTSMKGTKRLTIKGGGETFNTTFTVSE